MALIDATPHPPPFGAQVQTYPIPVGGAGGGIRAAQVARLGYLRTPYVPYGTNLEGFTTDFQFTPYQRRRNDNYWPFNYAASPIARTELAAADHLIQRRQRKLALATVPPRTRRLDTPTMPYLLYSTQFWFNRLHILPVSAQTTELGNVVSDIDTTFEVFNAHKSEQASVAALNESGTDGFTVLSGASAPFVIGAYKGETYQIRCEAETGPPTILATYTWAPLSPFSSVSVVFLGNRVTVFAFIPQQNPVRRMNFKTAVVEAYNGTEQRMSVWDNPRMELQYGFRLGGEDDPYYGRPQAFEHYLFDSLGRSWLVPDWPDRTVLTANVTAGDTIINVNTDGRNFEVGELVTLWREWDDNESLEIIAVTSGTVEVASPFGDNYTVEQTIVLPAWIGFLDDGPLQRVYRKDYAEWTLNFRRRRNITWDLLGSPAGTVVGTEFYKGLPFWPFAHRISSNRIDRRWIRNIKFMETPGILEQSFKFTTPKRTNSEMILESRARADYEDMRSWLMYLRGRRGAFWLPSYTNNFNLEQTATGGSSAIRVTQSYYPRFVLEREQFNHIRITFTDGAVVNHEIIASADAGAGLMDLTLDPAVGAFESPARNYTAASIVRIEYITKHRLDTDSIVFQGLPITDQWRVKVPLKEVLGEV